MSELTGILLQLIAVAPGLLLVWLFYKWDVYEPEPAHLVVIAVVAGLASTFPTAVLGYLVGLHALPGPEASAGAVAIFALKVGLVEEGMKLLTVLAFFYRRPQFNEPVDGIVYLAAVALGFAILENVGYTLLGGAEVGLMRAVTAVPGHAVFSGIMGYFVGLARTRGRLGWILVGWGAGAATHGLYDFFAFRSAVYGWWILVYCSGTVVVGGVVLHFLMRRLLSQSPFKPLSERFRILKNLGVGSTYVFRCQVCGTEFTAPLRRRLVCYRDDCMNHYDFAPPDDAE